MTSSQCILFYIMLLATVSNAFYVLKSTKMGDLRKANLNTIVSCYKAYSKDFRNKRVYASTSGTTAKLFDEDGNEIDCSEFAGKTNHKYDQHCFFSPLNCFYLTIRQQKEANETERKVVE